MRLRSGSACPRDFTCRERASASGQAVSRVRTRSAQVKVADWRGVPRPTEQGPRDEQLIEGELAVKDVPAGEAVRLLEIGRRDDLTSDDRRREAWRATLDRACGDIGQRVALNVPRRAAQAIWRVLHISRDDVASVGRERRVDQRWDGELDPRIVGHAAVLRRVERALDAIEIARD